MFDETEGKFVYELDRYGVDSVTQNKSLSLAFDHYMRGLITLKEAWEVVAKFGYDGHAIRLMDMQQSKEGNSARNR
jgi:hypothetical protein